MSQDYSPYFSYRMNLRTNKQMNILLLSSFLIIAAVCWSRSFAGEVQPPTSINGATIRLNGRSYYPAHTTIERYEPGENAARLLMRYTKELMPRISEAAAVTGATATEEVFGEQVEPSTVVFTGKKGHVYSGTVSGSFYSFYNYRGKGKENLTILKDEKIEFIFPDDNRPVTGNVNGPEALGKGAIIQIRTDKRSLTCEKGKHRELLRYFLRYPDEKTAVLELDFPKDPENPDVSLCLSAANDPEEAMTMDNPNPYIAFTRKLSPKIYEGSLFGYLYGYTAVPEIEGSRESHCTIKFKEKLLSIVIILP